jgi:hypothetical protein
MRVKAKVWMQVLERFLAVSGELQSNFYPPSCVADLEDDFVCNIFVVYYRAPSMCDGLILGVFREWLLVCAASNSLKMDRNYYCATTHRNSFPLPSAWIRDIFPLRSSGSSDLRFITDSLRSHNSPLCFFLYLCSQSSQISTNPALTISHLYQSNIDQLQELTVNLWLTTKWRLSFSSWEHVFLEFLTWFTTPLQTFVLTS